MQHRLVGKGCGFARLWAGAVAVALLLLGACGDQGSESAVRQDAPTELDGQVDQTNGTDDWREVPDIREVCNDATLTLIEQTFPDLTTNGLTSEATSFCLVSGFDNGGNVLFLRPTYNGAGDSWETVMDQQLSGFTGPAVEVDVGDEAYFDDNGDGLSGLVARSGSTHWVVSARFDAADERKRIATTFARMLIDNFS